MKTGLSAANVATEQIDFTRVNSDINGNPRYVCHFTELINDGDRILSKLNKQDIFSVETQYIRAISKARDLGGRKYHNKSYGGGIVFQSYNNYDLTKRIRERAAVCADFKKAWNNADFRRAKRDIYSFMSTNNVKIGKGDYNHAHVMGYLNYSWVERTLGLAYTSSSEYAGLWLCNVNAWVSEIHTIQGFAINARNNVVAVCWDKDENELLIEI